jgi:hypothetical protein
MKRVLSPAGRIAVVAGAIGFLVAAVALTQTIPPVEGLGDKVRLPMFHGASTWVNIATFTIMGLFALLYLIFRRAELYRWEVGFKWVSAPLWIANSTMGVIAAANTWDFTGSSDTPLVVIRQDPRLLAQFQLLALLLLVLVLQWWLVHSDGWRSFLDLVYVIVFWLLLRGVFTDEAARALHPDSPVLNSAADIQIPFFSIVACLFVASCLVAWFVRDAKVRAD